MRFAEIVIEDARAIASEWMEFSAEDALAMVRMTRAAERSGDLLPEPAELAREFLRSHMTAQEVRTAWPRVLATVERVAKRSIELTNLVSEQVGS